MSEGKWTGDSPNSPKSTLTFHLYYDGQKSLLYLPKSSTVGDLKDAISRRYGVPPSQQYIEGWKVERPRDEVPLEECATAVNHLMIVKVCEAQVTLSFRENVVQYGPLPKYIKFCTDLDGALLKSCFAQLPFKKALLLFLYQRRDKFSVMFYKKLNEVKVKEVIQNFSVLAWDISDEKYHELLVKTLNLFELEPLTIFIEHKKSAAFCLREVNGRLASTCIYNDNLESTLEILKKADNHVKTLCELDLRRVEEEERKQRALRILDLQQMIANID